MSEQKISDAELDAFLSGGDALSRQLQAMEQPAPSAQLDAAILAQAEALMEKDRPRAPVARMLAANDAGPQTPASTWRPGRRWRVPTGIAAALVAGVLAQQTWQAERDIDGVSLLPPAPTQSAPAAAPPPVEEKPRAALPAADAAPVPQAAARATARRPAPPPAPVAESEVAAPQAPVQAEAPASAFAPPAAPVAAPAPAPAYAPPLPAPVALGRASAPVSASAFSELQAKSAPRPVVVVDRRSRVEAGAQSPAQSAADPADWLAAIDEMLRAGLRRDTLEEWDRFRAAYPDYPVPAQTIDKINALKN